MLVDAIRLKDRRHVEVWVDRVVRFGSCFTVEGVKYRRIPSRTGKPTFSNGADPGFHRKGPIVQWTEPLAGRGPVRAKHYTKDGYVVATSVKDLREYEAKSKDTGRPVQWTR